MVPKESLIAFFLGVVFSSVVFICLQNHQQRLEIDSSPTTATSSKSKHNMLSSNYYYPLPDGDRLLESEYDERDMTVPMEDQSQRRLQLPLLSHQNKGPVLKPTRFLLGIFTTIEEVARRKRLRQYIFKNPERGDERVCSLNDFLQWEQDGRPNSCQVVYTFVLGMNPNAPTIHLESGGKPILFPWDIPGREDDVTYLNIKENMNDGKTPTWFKYGAQLSPKYGPPTFDYIGKLDSDTLISLPDLLHLVDNELPTKHPIPRNIYGGILCDQTACGTKQCERVMQGKVYMTGQFYFVSNDLAQYISDDSLERKAISNYSEDVDFAMWVHSRNQILRLYILNNKNVFWIHNAKSIEKMDQRYNDYFVKQRKFPKYSFWLKPKWWGR